MLRELRQAVMFTVVAMALFGGAYHAAIWGIGRVFLPAQAEGSLIRRADGSIAGSRLIAQPFTQPQYFHPRPSGVDHNAASTGGTNYAASTPAQVEAVARRRAERSRTEAIAPGDVPSELVTASGAGLDPHISPAAAEVQAARVAAARKLGVDAVRALIAAKTERPLLGFIGRTRVNVLELNLALDGLRTP